MDGRGSAITCDVCDDQATSPINFFTAGLISI
jgi:hypothetical protein